MDEGNQAKQPLLSNLSSCQVWTSFLYCGPKTRHCTPDTAANVLNREGNHCHTGSALAPAAHDAVGLDHHISTLLVYSTSLSCPSCMTALCLGDALPLHLHGLLHSRWRTLHCLCQMSPHFCQAILSSVSGCLSVAAWPPSAATAPTNSVLISTQTSWGCLLLQSSDLKRRQWTSANGRGTFLVTNHHLYFQLLTTLGDQQSRQLSFIL